MAYALRNNRQVFVCKTSKDSSGSTVAGYVKFNTSGTSPALQETDALGMMRIGKDADGLLYISQMGIGGLVRSALIKKSEIATAKAKKATDLNTQLYTKTVNVTTGTIQAGSLYSVKLTLHDYSAVDAGFVKYAAGNYVAKSGDTANVVADALVTSLQKDPEHGISFSVALGSSGTEIEVTEMLLPFQLGKTQPENLVRRITCSINGIYDSINEVYDFNWATIDNVGTSVSANDYMNKVRDMEWYLMGDRAEQYHFLGGKNNPIEETELMIGANDTIYGMIDIHWDSLGDGSILSNKDMILFFETQQDANDFIADWNTATGMSVATI